jgi:hypothetical protein
LRSHAGVPGCVTNQVVGTSITATSIEVWTHAAGVQFGCVPLQPATPTHAPSSEYFARLM